IELRFSASLRMMDFNRDGVDVAIRFGRGADPGLYSIPLAEEWVTPLMLPELAARYPTPESLKEAVLIVDQSIDFLKPSVDWDAWFRAMGVAPPALYGPKFSQADHAVDAALAGVGVVLGRRALSIKDIAEGRLVAPFRVALNTGGRFRFICQDGLENRPQIAAFRDWMLSEIEKTRDVADSFDVRDIPQ
ncbi:MAG: LysR substrate-binding domain-containing protein, partial [Pseudomonadota bacterium]